MEELAKTTLTDSFATVCQDTPDRDANWKLTNVHRIHVNTEARATIILRAIRARVSPVTLATIARPTSTTATPQDVPMVALALTWLLHTRAFVHFHSLDAHVNTN